MWRRDFAEETKVIEVKRGSLGQGMRQCFLAMRDMRDNMVELQCSVSL